MRSQRWSRKIGPTRLRILDLKANDIPNTMRMVRDGAFRGFGFDAVTVTPWIGWETLAPFLEDTAHGVFVVAHSSNPGSVDFQEIPTPRGPLWLAVVGEVRRLAHTHGNVGVVIGATFSEGLRTARATLGNGMPILVPGIGAQGGSLATTVREGVDAHGRALLVNASRSILYASAGPDWKRAAGAEAVPPQGPDQPAAPRASYSRMSWWATIVETVARLGPTATGRAHPPRERGVVEEAAHLAREVGRDQRLREQPLLPVLDHFAHARDVRDHHRKPDRHRLGHRKAEPLEPVLRREDEHVREREQAGQVVVRNVRAEHHSVAHAEPAREPDQRLEPGPEPITTRTTSRGSSRSAWRMTSTPLWGTSRPVKTMTRFPST